MYKVGAIFFAAAFAAASGLSGALLAATPARAESCPGNPTALGTSRVLAIKFGDYTRLGRMQYPETLPLADKEVVITFDDGPHPLLSDRVLDILASQCVKVTYFIIGEMAQYYPDLVRREYEAGHSIGTHSQDHPLRFDKLTDAQVQQEIDQGIASVGAALGDANELAPFFRIPGLGRTDTVERELAARSLIVFSADVVADDWFRHITPAQIIQRAMSRLEKSGKGILLLHDIHPATVLALPGLLAALKEKGFRIVHVVPAEPETAGAPKAWMLASASPEAGLVADAPAAPKWPQPDLSVTPDDSMLPAPNAAAFDVNCTFWPDASLAEDSAASRQWPNVTEAALPSSAAELPAPGLRDIGVSMRGQKLVGADLGLRPSLGVRATTQHEKVRHVHLHARHPGRVPVAAEGQHADLSSGIRSVAALLTPAH